MLKAKIPSFTRREAIRQHCYMCSDFEWQEVISCEKEDCLLYDFRMGKEPAKEQTSLDRADAIAKFCLNSCAGGNVTERNHCEANECSLHSHRTLPLWQVLLRALLKLEVNNPFLSRKIEMR